MGLGLRVKARKGWEAMKMRDQVAVIVKLFSRERGGNAQCAMGPQKLPTLPAEVILPNETGRKGRTQNNNCTKLEYKTLAI